MKTLHIKIIVLSFFLFPFSFCLKAQPPTGKKAMCDELMKNQYVFEGKIVSFKQHYTIKIDAHTYENYDSYILEVTKVVRGNLVTGTINLLVPTIGVIYKDSTQTRYASQPSDGGLPVAPKEGLYFCYAITPKIDSSFKTTNKVAVEYYSGNSMSNGELKKDGNDHLIGYFPTIRDFYAYISENYGVSIK